MTDTGCMAVLSISISLVHSEFMTDTGCMAVIYSISLVHSLIYGSHILYILGSQ